ncbi:MAG: methionyl-tRNA formyltransferase [Oculatellaceae cyanobacterium bins.114]|nr:methionyl-tRNA formyltransferase [Oculatellaceae cyanobacterium bins.114]
MRLVFFGTPEFAVPSLKTLLSHPDFDVLAVVTQPDKRRGRGTDLSPSPIKAIALEHQLTVWQPARIKKDADTLQQLRDTNADAFVVVAYGQILSQEILEMPRLGCINAHGSLLPYYRGAAPIQWSIYHGETTTGITTMLMDAGMDTGAMLVKATTPIGLMDNAWDLATTLSAIAADTLVETLIGLDQQTIQPVSQDHEQATYAPLIKKEDYQLNWSRSAIALHNQVRGFYPNCVTLFRGAALKVIQTMPLNATVELTSDLQAEVERLTRNQSTAPGTVVSIVKNQGLVVQTGDGLLLLTEVQLAGKRSQSGWDFVNGTRLTVGEPLGA